MKCPGNSEHRGIEVVKIPKQNDWPHYAKAICAECRVRIKWLGKKEADYLEGIRKEIIAGPRGVREESKRDGFSDREIEQIREIVREEIQNMRGER